MKASSHPNTLLATRGFRGGLLICLVASCSVQDAAPADPASDNVVDAFAQRPADPARTAALLATAQSLVRPGSVTQTEPRLGVPTFLWAREPATATAHAQWLTAGITHPEVAAARQALASYAPLYKLNDADVASAVVASVHDLGTGPVIVKYRAEVGGIEIFREELNVVMNRKLEPVALSGYLSSATTPAARGGSLTFGLSGPAAAIAAVNQLAHKSLDVATVVAAGSHDGYDYFSLTPAAGVALDEPVRLKKVYFHAADGLEPAYYVEVSARTGAARGKNAIATLDGGPVAASEAYSYVVSAVTGQPLFRKNLIADVAATAPRVADALPPGGFTYRVWADPVTGIPLDTPAGNEIDPKLSPVPDGIQAPFLAPSDITLPNFPFSRNDPWLPAGATETTGNNVEAFVNLFDPDGFGPAGAPADPPTGDFHAQITAPGAFLHTQIPDGNGALAEGRQGAIQQLFYNINFLHDWYYDAGFDEVAGNAQTNNLGRGGVGNDSIRGQAQDDSGFDNADMTTPADGGRPRMRMFTFISPANMLDIQTPANLARKLPVGIAAFGPQKFDVTGNLVVATFGAAPNCVISNAAALVGNIGVFNFDNIDGTGCGAGTRIARIEAAGAVGSVLIYTNATPDQGVNFIGFTPQFTKPIVTVAFNTGAALKTQIAAGQPMTTRMLRGPDRDGSLDQQIVFHEFFHYVSNRLVGNGSGLGTNHASGMGEGWSDFSSMLLTARETDTLVPSNATFNGVYSLASYATSGVPFDGSANNAYYFGIRRYPYSTDMTKNPLTFKHIAEGEALPVGPPLGFGADGIGNSEPHNTGEVWTTMLWECYAGLLRDTLGPTPRLTFQQAQDRMKRYVVAGLKATPVFPTFTEARDGILAAALASDPADFLVFKIAFAKRGAGSRAVSPDRFTFDNIGVVEDFSVGPDLRLDAVTLTDTADSCDHDGVLDHGEFGTLAVTLHNTGTTALTATTATVRSTSTGIWFPDGQALTFPTLAAGVTATVNLRVAYLGTVTGIQQVDFQVDYADPQVPGPLSKTVGFRTNTDDSPATSATETVEARTSPMTLGFAAALGNLTPWRRLEVTPLQHVWHADDPGAGADQYLISPPLTVGPTGQLNLQFDHSWSFEFDPAVGNFDGGVVEMSTNNGAFVDIGTAAYNGTLLVYTGNVNPIQGRRAFVQASNGTVHTTLTRTVAANASIRIRFRLASDSAGGASGWNIDNIVYGGTLGTPFATVVPETGDCAQAPSSVDLAIAVSDGVTSVHVGDAIHYTITASNAGGGTLPGVTVADAFPSELTGCTWTCAATAGATCTASGTGNLLDTIALPVGGVATYSASCTLPGSSAITSLSNTATIAAPGPVGDPVVANNTATDTDTVLRFPAHLTGSKTVTGNFVQGGSVTYAIVLHNDGTGKQFDNAGDELTDALPAGLTLVSATATTGTATAVVAENTVRWNGEIDAGASATITIIATITAPAGTLVSNQATFKYDQDGDATNEASGSTDAFVCTATP